MARSPGAINARQTVTTTFDVDPRGAGMFAGLSAVLQRGISGHTGTVYTGDRGAPEHSFNGDISGPAQHFTGAAALALYGAGRPHTPTSNLAHGIDNDTLNNPALRIFAARARRQGLNGTGL